MPQHEDVTLQPKCFGLLDITALRDDKGLCTHDAGKTRNDGHAKRKIRLTVPGPVNEMSTNASSRSGNEDTTSRKRETASSIRPRDNPASSPKMEPATAPIATALKPIRTE